MLTKEQITELETDLDSRHVKDRTQAGFTMSYIGGWHAIAEANRIFGHDGWHRETVELTSLGSESGVGNKDLFKVAYTCKVRITVSGPEDKEDIIREGIGFGNGMNRSLLDAHEMAAKEAETDATKRALMTFGWAFGLALYDKDKEHVSTNGKKDPIRSMANIDSVDHQGKEPEGPSPQALKIHDEFRTAPTKAVLATFGLKHKKTISALHKDDKTFLTQKYREIDAALEK